MDSAESAWERYWRLLQQSYYENGTRIIFREKLSQGTIEYSFRLSSEPNFEVMGDILNRRSSLAVLPEITTEVTIRIKPPKHGPGSYSARFTATECAELFGNERPNDESFGRIARAVLERKRYPMPVPEVPGAGGKSMTAQGQTKKDGSHSQDRHR